MSIEEFEEYYWYKDELIHICRANKLPTSGTKAELIKYIKQFLSGKEVRDYRSVNVKRRHRSNDSQKITLDMKLISGGFKFNQQARKFFQQYYGVPKFSFTKQMAAALRQAEQMDNLNMTVADLIEIYETTKNKKPIQTNEEKTYEWNEFVKDFYKDPRTKGMENQMKVAAILWNKVKKEKGSKKYHNNMLDDYLSNL